MKILFLYLLFIFLISCTTKKNVSFKRLIIGNGKVKQLFKECRPQKILRVLIMSFKIEERS